MDDAFASFDGRQPLLPTTFRRSGGGVPTPVWFARVGNTLVVLTSAQTGKVKLLRRDGRERIAPCNSKGKPKCPEQEAAARLVDGEAGARIEAALTAKYGWILRLTPRRRLQPRDRPRRLTGALIPGQAGGAAARGTATA